MNGEARSENLTLLYIIYDFHIFSLVKMEGIVPALCLPRTSSMGGVWWELMSENM